MFRVFRDSCSNFGIVLVPKDKSSPIKQCQTWFIDIMFGHWTIRIH